MMWALPGKIMGLRYNYVQFLIYQNQHHVLNRVNRESHAETSVRHALSFCFTSNDMVILLILIFIPIKVSTLMWVCTPELL